MHQTQCEPLEQQHTELLHAVDLSRVYEAVSCVCLVLMSFYSRPLPPPSLPPNARFLPESPHSLRPSEGWVMLLFSCPGWMLHVLYAKSGGSFFLFSFFVVVAAALLKKKGTSSQLLIDFYFHVHFYFILTHFASAPLSVVLNGSSWLEVKLKTYRNLFLLFVIPWKDVGSGFRAAPRGTVDASMWSLFGVHGVFQKTERHLHLHFLSRTETLQRE